MTKDLMSRFHIDEKRIYDAGMSGGARVATQIAFGTGRIAGVIAASAGLPDSQPRKTIPFPIFGTAGTEDFNWLEMKQLDHALKSPHRLKIFEGGHVWLPKELAREAIEWLELIAMRTRLRPTDTQLVNRLYSERETAAKAAANSENWRHLAEDFAGLHEGAAEAMRTAIRLEKDKSFKDALPNERKEIDLELEWRNEIAISESSLKDPTQRTTALDQLSTKLNLLAAAISKAKTTPEHRAALRIARGLNSVTTEPHSDGCQAMFLRAPP